MYSRTAAHLETTLYPAGVWYGPVPREDQSLQRAAKTQEYRPDQRHYPRGTQGLCVPREGLRRHAHFREELQASAWRASLKAFLSDSLRSGSLPPEWHSAGRLKAPQVRVCRWEEVSSLRVLCLCVYVCVEETCKDRWDLLFREVSVLFSLSSHFLLPLSHSTGASAESLSRCSPYHSTCFVIFLQKRKYITNRNCKSVRECDYFE